MLLKIKKVKTEEETVELKLPAFFQDGQWLFMITEEETVIRIHEPSRGIVISTWEKDNLYHEEHLQEAYNGVPVSPYVFCKVWHQAFDHLEKTVQTPLFTK